MLSDAVSGDRESCRVHTQMVPSSTSTRPVPVSTDSIVNELLREGYSSNNEDVTGLFLTHFTGMFWHVLACFGMFSDLSGACYA